MPADTLCPWSHSEEIRHASSEKIGLLIGHCVVGVHRRFRPSHRQLTLGQTFPAKSHWLQMHHVDAAIYFTRYSVFLPVELDEGLLSRDIAGDNAMYNGALLRRHMASFRRWILGNEFHETIRDEGSIVMCAPQRLSHSDTRTISK